MTHHNSNAPRQGQETAWLDTKQAAKQLSMSNRRLLSLLDKHGFTQKNKAGQRTVTPKGKSIARLSQRSWVYNGSDKSAHGEQYYWVVQINLDGLFTVRNLL